MNEITEAIVGVDRSLLEAAIREIREWKVDKGGDDQVVLNLEAGLASIDRAITAALAAAEEQEPVAETLPCPCTTFEQSEECPIGYPSLLCHACDGTGNAPIDKVVALAAEMLKVAEQVDELEDPFAAWESIDLLLSGQKKPSLEEQEPVAIAMVGQGPDGRGVTFIEKHGAPKLPDGVHLLYTRPSPSGEAVEARRFQIGNRVRKTKGSSWQGLVVGFYSTELTPIGYCVESEREPGSVQIYPEAALSALTQKDKADEAALAEERKT